MDVRFESRDGALIVTPGGNRLDAESAPDFRSKVAERVAGSRVVVIDLRGVVFVDSSGLAALISVLKRVPAGGQLRLAGPQAPVRTLLSITRMEKVFGVYDSLDAALRG